MLALDQRGSFEKLIGTSDEQVLGSKKKQIIEALLDIFTGVLIDPTYGWMGYKQTNCQKPFLLCGEKSGYENIQGERLTKIKYGPAELKSMGAFGVKLLVYFNPFLASAQKQLQTTLSFYQECHQVGLPLFFEIVTYGETMDKNLVTESVDYFIRNDFCPEVWKLEYPGSQEACQYISRVVKNTPWIMLTAGAKFDDFCQKLEIACGNGCSGFLAGRSIWQDVVTNDIGKAEIDLMRQRFKKIVSIVESNEKNIN